MTDERPGRSRRSVRQNLFELQADASPDTGKLLTRVSRMLDAGADIEATSLCVGQIRGRGDAEE